jgi:hypothetical protein
MPHSEESHDFLSKFNDLRVCQSGTLVAPLMRNSVALELPVRERTVRSATTRGNRQ